MTIIKRTNHTRAEALRIVHKAPTGTWFYVTVSPPLPTIGARSAGVVRPRLAHVRLSRVAAKGVIKDLLNGTPDNLGITLAIVDLSNGSKTIYIGG